jgi:hypothetical protein
VDIKKDEKRLDARKSYLNLTPFVDQKQQFKRETFSLILLDCGERSSGLC